MDFTHLHLHTGYSLLDGAGTIKRMVARAKELGFKALAITDHGVMYGAVEFYEECKKNGIKPIIGCEVYVAPGSRFEKVVTPDMGRYYHLILLAKNEEGYHNLIKLVSKGFTEGYYYKPRIDRELLEKYHEGLVCTSACVAGEVAQYIIKGFYTEAVEVAKYYRSLFGDDYYLELQEHPFPDQQQVNQGLMRIHAETGIPLVATNDVHYVLKEDSDAHSVLVCISSGKKITDEDRLQYEPEEYYLRSAEEMAELFPYAPEAVENTNRIAEKCNYDFRFNEYKLPRFPVPDGSPADEYFTKLCYEGLKRLYPSTWQDNTERLDYELGVIKKMGYVDYFLIVADYIKYAEDNGIPVGPGRGSAAGSIVSYCLGITKLDPIKYQLIFERFLNPERVSMPDIDVDFEPEGRQKVIDYVVEKYGEECVCQIIAFGTLKARGVVRDVGRVLDVAYAKCDRLAKMIPGGDPDITIDDAINMNPDLVAFINEDEEAAEIIRYAKKLEGLPRQASIHAAGVVISNAPVDDYVPLQRSAEGNITTEFEKNTVERLGLLKMDFLGLRNLTIIRDAERIIRQKNPDFDIRNIPIDDAEVYKMIGEGKTEGIFQIEGGGMTSFMKQLRPESLEDLIAGISLYRPGPMDFIPKYLKGKNNKDSIEYDCPELEPILEPTYGCIVYQEQVMQIVRDLAGYSFGQSDVLRRAMSKKHADEMEAGKNSFIYGDEKKGIPGCVSRGISEAVASKIYDEMLDFASYAFNKSHAACYALVSYQTAYLKCHYPAEYMACLISSVMDSTGKVVRYIRELKKLGITLNPPDINLCRADFYVDGNKVYYGLSAIKGLGRSIIDEIVADRENLGPFKDIKDFCVRMVGVVNKRAIEGLIKAGAFDSIPGSRKQLMIMYSGIVDDAVAERKKNVSGQLSFFDFMEEADAGESAAIAYPDIGEFTAEELLAFEKEAMGYYVSGHPLDEYADELERQTTKHAVAFAAASEDEEEADAASAGESVENDPDTVGNDEMVIVGGMVTGIKKQLTKTNDQMAIVTIEDLTGDMEIVMFPKIYLRFRDQLEEGSKIFVLGRTQTREGRNTSLICTNLMPMDDIHKTLYIQYDDIDSIKADELKLSGLLEECERGTTDVTVYAKKEKQMKPIKEKRITVTGDFVKKLSEIYGSDNIKVMSDSLKRLWDNDINPKGYRIRH
ncbi:MAG: DNA polymerase III subunit alpha [Lachnospiraceae bacterium]|nr:DNA polymerase III subunit alpha [Lachnospiraceae bacterium]